MARALRTLRRPVRRGAGAGAGAGVLAEASTKAGRGPRSAREATLALAVAAAPAVTALLFLLPLGAGLLGTWGPAFGWLPALEGRRLSLEPWAMLFAHPSFPGAVRVTLVSGLGSALCTLALALLFSALFYQTRLAARLAGLLPALLSVPHAALAIGLAFLLAPSGPFFRLSLALFGVPADPPGWVTVQDRFGLALALGLVVKELPFLLLMLFACPANRRARALWLAARSLGHGPVSAWSRAVLPALWPELRLPFFAVLAYSLSVVDMAILLGPGTPPSLAVLVLELFRDPDLSHRFAAAAGATVQLGLAGAAILVWLAAERALARPWASWCASGPRRKGALHRAGEAALARCAAGAGLAALAAGVAALAALAAWSFAGPWRWPALLPEGWTTEGWRAVGGPLLRSTLMTALLAAAAAAAAAALSALCLENESRRGRGLSARGAWLLYLPLLLPQVSVMFGITVLAVRLRLDGSFLGLFWTHFVFVLPYVFLVLAGPWRSLDPRFAAMAATLGHGPGAVFLRVRLAQLRRTLALGFAVGAAVSVAQYVPTLLLVGGGWSTLALEAVAAGQGAGRRTVAVWAFAQALLPLLFFSLALSVPLRQAQRTRSC